MDNEEYPGTLKGHFLTAMPNLADPNFSHTVTCLCDHSDKGAFGLVINRLHSELKWKDLFTELELEFDPQIGSHPIQIGGPVYLNQVFVLHGPPFHWQGCMNITPNIAVSNSMDIIEAIAAGNGPPSTILTFGCANWAANQLEFEIKSNAWLIYPVFEELIFETEIADRWETAIRKMGIDPLLLSTISGHA